MTRSTAEILHALGNALQPMCDLVDAIDLLEHEAAKDLGVGDIHADAVIGMNRSRALLSELRDACAKLEEK